MLILYLMCLYLFYTAKTIAGDRNEINILTLQTGAPISYALNTKVRSEHFLATVKYAFDNNLEFYPSKSKEDNLELTGEDKKRQDSAWKIGQALTFKPKNSKILNRFAHAANIRVPATYLNADASLRQTTLISMVAFGNSVSEEVEELEPAIDKAMNKMIIELKEDVRPPNDPANSRYITRDGNENNILNMKEFGNRYFDTLTNEMQKGVINKDGVKKVVFCPNNKANPSISKYRLESVRGCVVGPEIVTLSSPERRD